MVQTHSVDVPQAEKTQDDTSHEVVARDDKVIWPAAFNLPPSTKSHPPICPKPQKHKVDLENDPYAYLQICPACDSVVHSIKCKLVCPNCHAIVQSCCD